MSEKESKVITLTLAVKNSGEDTCKHIFKNMANLIHLNDETLTIEQKNQRTAGIVFALVSSLEQWVRYEGGKNLVIEFLKDFNND